MRPQFQIILTILACLTSGCGIKLTTSSQETDSTRSKSIAQAAPLPVQDPFEKYVRSAYHSLLTFEESDVPTDIGNGTVSALRALRAPTNLHSVAARIVEDVPWAQAHLNQPVLNPNVAIHATTWPFRKFLKRPPTQAELNSFDYEEMDPMSVSQTIFIGGYNYDYLKEYYKTAGGTDAAFVTSLYQDILGRAPDAGGLNGCLSYIANWRTPYGLNCFASSDYCTWQRYSEIALFILESPEAYWKRCNDLYEHFLNRQPGTGELQACSVYLSYSTDHLIEMEEMILASAEYWKIVTGTDLAPQHPKIELGSQNLNRTCSGVELLRDTDTGRYTTLAIDDIRSTNNLPLLSFYTDSACTQEVTSANPLSFKAGEDSTTLWVKVTKSIQDPNETLLIKDTQGTYIPLQLPWNSW